MKKLIVCIVALGICICAGLSGLALADMAPNGTKSQALTVNSTTVNLALDTKYAIYGVSGCKMRLMPTSAKGNYVAVPVGTESEYTPYEKNPKTPFLNLTGCNESYLIRQ